MEKQSVNCHRFNFFKISFSAIAKPSHVTTQIKAIEQTFQSLCYAVQRSSNF